MAVEKVCPIRDRIAARIGSSRFQTWFGNATDVDLTQQGICVTVPNAFVGEWIANNYLSDLQEVARDIVGVDATVDVRVDATAAATAGNQNGQDSPSAPPRPREHRSPAPVVRAAPQLRGDLDAFVVGPSNQLAYSAAKSVINSPLDAFRPLFVHGGCGLGKTHLLQGICNGLRMHHPTLRWCYISGEEFTNEFISAVKAGRIDAFRARFRKVDLLVIDDIHFLANKKATQEEFLHTFNAIDGGGRTVVLSSDRHPRSIATLSEPLINRLIAGMVVEIKPPDYGVRREILARRVKKMACDIPDDVLDLVASQITRNVRELEGALFKLAALASLMKERITPDLVRSVLSDYLVPDTGPLQVEDIEREVCDYFSVTRERLNSRTRDRTVSLARAIAMYLVRKYTSLSYPEIGRAMGNKNHSTVVMAVGRIQNALADDAAVHWKNSQGSAIEKRIRAVLCDIEGQFERASH